MRRRPPRDREIRDEIHFYLEERTRELEARGLSPEAARRAALEAFGDPERVASSVEAIHRGREGMMRRTLDEVLADVRHAVRRLARTPGLTAVAAVTLALAMGVTSAAFAVADAYFLKNLPYDEPERLVTLWETLPGSPESTTVAPGNFHDWDRSAASFSGMAAFNVLGATLSEDGTAERVTGSLATPDLFEVLGVRPLHGSGFRAEHGDEANAFVVVLSHGLWVRRFGADRSVVGTTIRIDGSPHEVVGVMPPDFRFPASFLSIEPAELWVPIRFGSQAGSREFRYLHVVGRAASGRSLEEAREEMASIARALAADHPEFNAGRSAALVPLDEQVFGTQRPLLLLLFAAAGLVLLLACVNLAGLLLARGSARGRELAVQAALGSGRLRVARQLVVEAVVLVALGGAAGVAALAASAGALHALASPYLNPLAAVRVDGRVLLFTAGLAMAAALTVGALPALSLSRSDVRGLLDGRGGTRRSGRGRTVLVAAQSGLALVLVVGAGLLGRSFLTLMSVPPGFAVDDALTFHVRPPPDVYRSGDDILAYYERLSTRIESLPGVVATGLVSDLPLTSENRSLRVRPTDRPEEDRSVEYHSVSPGYLQAAGIPLFEGRDFATSDAVDAPLVVLVSRLLARQLWPGGGGPGERLHFPASGLDGTVVGVVGDILDDGLDGTPEPRLYLAFAQSTNRNMSVVVRTGVPPERVLPLVRSGVAEVDERVPVSALRTMTDHVAASVAWPRGLAGVTQVFGALALLLVGVGVYGMLAHAVTERTRELAVRAALGARRGELIHLVFRDSVRVVGAGATAGLLLSALSGRVLSSLLFGVRPWDPVVLVGALGTLAAAAALAAGIPARRASRADPAAALREG